MGKIKTDQLGRVKSLYYEKCLSMNDIAIELGVSINAVCYFMRKNLLKRRAGSENSALLFSCYSNQKPNKLIDFWSKITRIPKSQFIKPYVREDFRPDKEDKMKHGMVHIRYSDKKLLLQLMEWIEEFKGKYCVGTQVVNEDAL